MSGNHSLRTRYQSSRVFQLSGFPDQERKELAKCINSLGGIYQDAENFKANSTHVVCGKLSRSEKFLGACATGKWVLHPQYIYNSSSKGTWLEENDYEWPNFTLDATDVPNLQSAPRRWRYHREAFGTCAFTGWKTAVVVSGAKKNLVYKRLLQSGGAEVFNLKLPVTAPEKIINTLTYVFVSEKCAPQVCHLMEYGVLCLKPEFIGDYLVKEPAPDPIDYLVNVSSSIYHSLSAESLDSSQSFIVCSGSSDILPLSNSTSRSNSPGSSDIRSICSGQKHQVSSPLTLENDTNSRVASPCNADPSLRPPDTVKSNSTLIANNSLQQKPVKRKHQDAFDIDHVLEELKKQKVSQTRYIWKPTVTMFTKDPVDQQGVPTEFSEALTGMIHSCLDEETTATNFISHAIDLAISSISPRKFPKAATLHCIMRNVLQNANSQLLANKAFNMLMKMVLIHPPTTPALVQLYMSSLRGGVVSGADVNCGQQWEFIKSVIQNTLQEPPEGYSSVQFENMFYNNILLLKFLVAVLEQNFKHCVESFKDGGAYKIGNCLLAQILWTSTYHIGVSSRCLQLISLFGDCLCSLLDNAKKTQLLILLLPLVSICAECCNLVEGKGTVHLGQKTSLMVNEIAKLIDIENLDNHMLRCVLQRLQPSWLCLHVCCKLLQNMDDYLLLEGAPKDDCLSLRTIVSRYFFMLPKLKSSTTGTPHKKRIPARRSKTKDEFPTQESKENSCITNNSASTKINKKNFKGETALHTACIKNDVVKVKQLLKVQGIDVNIQDNAGWTPLHEACNHGNVQCVKELLNFVPAITMEKYFSKGEQKCRKVDLLAATDAGITPLHDAVLSNRQEVCKLLLKHGGSKLLNSKTSLDYSPLDLAATEDMKNILLSYQDLPSSQGNESSQENNTPSSYLYQRVFGEDNHTCCTDTKDCSKYISIITSTVKAYLDVIGIQHILHIVQDTLSKTQDTGNEMCSDLTSSAIEDDDLLLVSSQGLKESSSIEEENVLLGSSQGFKEPSSVDRDTLLKSDLRVVKKMTKHLSKFEDHIMKICDSNDEVKLQGELITLHCMAESVSLKG